MAHIKEMERKRKNDDEAKKKKMRRYENVMSERKAAEIAATPNDSPLIGRAMEYVDYRYVDAGCANCSWKDCAITDLTSKNASLVKTIEELRWQIRTLQDEVAMPERDVHYDPHRRYF